MATLICPVCGTENPTTRQFCRKCASDLRAPVPNPNAPVGPPPVQVPVRPIVLGAVAALLLVILAIAAFLFFAGSPSASPAPSRSASPTAAATIAPTPTAGPSIAPTAAPTPTQAPTTEPEPTQQPAPIIVSFVGPKTVNCHDGTFNGTIHLTWRVTFADGATLAIDGPGLYKSYIGVIGQDDVPFGCGGEPHTYVLTTTGGNGPPATMRLVISPA